MQEIIGVIGNFILYFIIQKDEKAVVIGLLVVVDYIFI